MLPAKPLLATLSLGFLAVIFIGASPARIPAVMIGTWAHGTCSVAQNRLVIGSHMAKVGVAKPAAIYFDADDGGSHAAIHWDQEYVVDNFVYVAEKKAIVHNTQGFGMPGAMLYKRCKWNGNP